MTLILRDHLWLRNSMSTSLYELVQFFNSSAMFNVETIGLTFSAPYVVVLEAPVIRGTTSCRSTWLRGQRHNRSLVPLASHASCTTVSTPTVIRI
jgi:hypothetical protein